MMKNLFKKSKKKSHWLQISANKQLLRDWSGNNKMSNGFYGLSDMDFSACQNYSRYQISA